MMRTVADLVNALENDNTVFMITINGQTITEGKIVCDNVDELDWELDNEKMWCNCEDLLLSDVVEIKQSMNRMIAMDDVYKIVTNICVVF
ncbi:MAG: hypothetical protein ACRCWQ_08680 [Bacilli bacterium]